jgi:hypothetical protein
MPYSGKEQPIEFMDNMALIREGLQWIFTKNDKGEHELNLSFTKNLYPYFCLDNKRYVGACDGLGDCSFYEFLIAHQCYLLWHQTRDVQYLDRLTAALYVQEVDNRRPAFDDYSYNIRCKVFGKLDLIVKYGVYLWFESCMLHLMNHERYKVVFNRGTKKADADDDAGLGLSAVVYDFNERGLTNNLDHLYNCHDILYMDYRKNKEIEKMMKR